MKKAKKIWYYAKHLILFVGLVVCGCGAVYTAMVNDEHFCEYGEWQILEEPLCEEDGLKVRYCNLNPSHAQQLVVSAKGHDYEYFSCKDCGAEQVSVGLEYEETGNGLRIVGIGTCRDKELAIPQEIDGKKVVEIGDNAFFSNKNIIELRIPDTVTTIDANAFGACFIESATIPASACSYIEKSNLKSVKITSGTIGSYEFSSCECLTDVVIGESVTSIGEGAFSNCESLTSVTIGGSVTSIGKEAFFSCESLTSIEVSEENITYKDIDGNLYSKVGSILIQYAIGKPVTEFIIPDSVTTIGNSAFYNCDSLASVVIPDSVTTIGNYAFESCSSLTSVVIPDSVTTIGSSAFYDCPIESAIIPAIACSYINKSNLKSVVITSGMIGSDAFGWCSNLTSVVINGGAIGNSAFYECSNLTSVEIGDNVTSMGNYAFAYCRSLTSVVMGDSVNTIGYYAFYSCESLTSVYYKGTASEWAGISIGSSNAPLTKATRYYYSETNVAGCWHYNENREVVVW